MQALLIVDIQNDYFPGGAMELVGSAEAAERAAALLPRFRTRGLPVIHMQHVSLRPGATFFLPKTEGVKIHASVTPDGIRDRHREALPEQLPRDAAPRSPARQGHRPAAIAGMMTHMCIDTTTRAAADLGFECQLAHDACATRDLAFAGRRSPRRTCTTRSWRP
jgi:Amidases related to nicotinamidase